MVTRWLLTLTLTASAASAQDFPAHPVKIVVPGPPAATSTSPRAPSPRLLGCARTAGDRREPRGRGGRIGTTAVAKSPADGYALLLGSSGTMTAGPAVFKNISYDPVKDFIAIGPIQSVPIVLTAAPQTRCRRTRSSSRSRIPSRAASASPPRERLLEPPCDRAADAPGAPQAAARSLQRQRTGDHRPPRKPGRDHDGSADRLDRAHPERAHQGARG